MPHFRHLLSIRVLPCLTVRVLLSNASFTKRSVSSRIVCFDISLFLTFLRRFHRGWSYCEFHRFYLSAHPIPFRASTKPRHTIKPPKIRLHSELTDAIRLPARAVFRAASRWDGNSGSLLRSQPTIQSSPRSLNPDTRRNVRHSNPPHCDRAGSS